MLYRRIEDNSDLPTPEPMDDLEFKTYADEKRMWEHSKDLAAFANAFGGVVLVGADNKTDPTALKYPGVHGQTIAQVMKIYEDAGAMCSPPQDVDAIPLKGPSGVELIAVNVAPFVEQLVAAPAGHDSLGKLSDAWRFPIRRGSQTDFVDPKDLGMYSNPQARRAQILLARIPASSCSAVSFFFSHDTQGSVYAKKRELRLEISSERNFIVVHSPRSQCRIPLSDVLEVWEESDTRWAVKVSGAIFPTLIRRKLHYVPRFSR